jgi:hypothetical protein
VSLLFFVPKSLKGGEIMYKSKTEKVLDFLRERGEEGATNFELSTISLNYTSCISNLYKQGHIIECRQTGNSDTYKYILRKLNGAVIYYPTAYQDFVHKMYTVFDGKIEGEEELIALMDLVGINMFRKHGYYKEQMKNEYERFEQQMHFDLD